MGPVLLRPGWPPKRGVLAEYGKNSTRLRDLASRCSRTADRVDEARPAPGRGLRRFVPRLVAHVPAHCTRECLAPPQLQGEGGVPLVHRKALRGPDRAPHRRRASRRTHPSVGAEAALRDPRRILGHGETAGPANRVFAEDIAGYYGHDGKARHSGAVSFLQRFGAALNLHVHSHVLAISGPSADGRERLVHYVSRPLFPEQEVQLCRDGRVAFRLTHPKPSGETHLFLHPMAFLRRVTSQIPPLGMNMVRHLGILAPAAKRRRDIARTAPPPHSPSAEGAGPSYLPNSSWAPC